MPWRGWGATNSMRRVPHAPLVPYAIHRSARCRNSNLLVAKFRSDRRCWFACCCRRNTKVSVVPLSLLKLSFYFPTKVLRDTFYFLFFYLLFSSIFTFFFLFLFFIFFWYYFLFFYFFPVIICMMIGWFAYLFIFCYIL